MENDIIMEAKELLLDINAYGSRPLEIRARNIIKKLIKEK